MRLPFLSILAIAMAASGCSAAAPSASQFDLDCRGTVTKDGKTGPFATLLHVDLGRDRFCFDACGFFVDLTSATPQRLTLHYDIDAPGGPKPYGYVAAPVKSSPPARVTAGPWQQQDDLSFDRATGAYRRDDVYDAGDPAAKRYVEHYVGTCRTRTYTGP